MKISIESTDQIVTLVGNGCDVPARLWEGKTEAGVPVHCFITRIVPTVIPSDDNEDLFTQFERELLEQRKPSVDVAVIPLRLIL